MVAELRREAAGPGASPPWTVAAAASPAAQPHLWEGREEASLLSGCTSWASSRFRGIVPKPTLCDPGGSPPLHPCPAGPSGAPRALEAPPESSALPLRAPAPSVEKQGLVCGFWPLLPLPATSLGQDPNFLVPQRKPDTTSPVTDCQSHGAQVEMLLRTQAPQRSLPSGVCFGRWPVSRRKDGQLAEARVSAEHTSCFPL